MNKQFDWMMKNASKTLKIQLLNHFADKAIKALKNKDDYNYGYYKWITQQIGQYINETT